MCQVRGNLSRILGKGELRSVAVVASYGVAEQRPPPGILFAEGEDHRRQKKIMTPAFSPAALRELTPTFFEMAYKLRDVWATQIGAAQVDESAFATPERLGAYKKSRPEGEVIIEVLQWMSRITLVSHAYKSLEPDADNVGRTSLGPQVSVMSSTHSR